LPIAPLTLRADDVFRHEMAGGGGYGDPLDREPEAVREDLLDDKVTRGHARAAYGVVMAPGDLAEVDVAATRALRRDMRASRQAVP
jgi:N-methylhydantoinase B